MFKAIEINNYQSHKHTVLDLHEGVNVVIGSSASGKTAIFRAIGWIKNNRPLSTRQLSRWIKDKGKLKGEASATLTTKDGHTISRVRSKDENYYQIDDQEHFDAPKAQVPEEVTKLLNLTEVNVQNQMDQPFLVSFTGPEVSRFLNNVIRMDIIDKTLSNAEKRKRQYRKKIEELTHQLGDVQIEIDAFAWLDGPVNDIVPRIEVITAKKEEIDASIQDIEKSIQDIKYWKNTIPKISDWHRVQQIIDSLHSNIEKREQITTEGVLLRKQIEDCMDWQQAIPTWDIDRAQEIINALDKVMRQNDEIRREETDVEKQINGIAYFTGRILENNKDIKRYQATLPDVCPLCGAPMERSHI